MKRVNKAKASIILIFKAYITNVAQVIKNDHYYVTKHNLRLFRDKLTKDENASRYLIKEKITAKYKGDSLIENGIKLFDGSFWIIN